jgi:hypothetical protein
VAGSGADRSGLVQNKGLRGIREVVCGRTIKEGRDLDFRVTKE